MSVLGNLLIAQKDQKGESIWFGVLGLPSVRAQELLRLRFAIMIAPGVMRPCRGQGDAGRPGLHPWSKWMGRSSRGFSGPSLCHLTPLAASASFAFGDTKNSIKPSAVVALRSARHQRGSDGIELWKSPGNGPRSFMPGVVAMSGIASGGRLSRRGLA
jgi:hypothetical protein